MFFIFLRLFPTYYLRLV